MIVTSLLNRRRADMDNGSIDISALTEHFELYNKTEGKSPKTVLWYNMALTQFQRFLTLAKKSTLLSELGETEVREFILFLQGKTKWQDNPFLPTQQEKLKAITIQTYVRALRGFFNWLYKEGYTTENRLARLKPPKAPIKVVDILTQEEIAKILTGIDQNTIAGARNYAILVLLLDAGLRSSELRNFEMTDINIQGGYLKVMGKGSKERIVPFGTTVQKAVLRYMLHFRPEPFNMTIQKFFLTLNGKPLTQNSIKMIFERLSSRSGIKRLHPHLCRHTFATNYLINGGDVFSLQQILGHTTLEMVRHYVNLASSQTTIQHRKYSPMDRLDITRPNISCVKKAGNKNTP